IARSQADRRCRCQRALPTGRRRRPRDGRKLRRAALRRRSTPGRLPVLQPRRRPRERMAGRPKHRGLSRACVMNDDAVLQRARAAGIAVDWIDASNRPQRVSTASLQCILDALHAGPLPPVPPLITATVGEPIVVPGVGDEAGGELQLEGEAARPITIYASVLPAIDRPGYHTLRFGRHEVTLAVAPPRCFTVADIAPGERLWGLAVQIYSLRRPGDLGIGDTTAVAMLARSAAEQGVDALALSPAHSLFPDDLARFSPYSPSSRLFLNPLLIDAGPDGADSGSPLIDWPAASEKKYTLFRRRYEDFLKAPSPAFD